MRSNSDETDALLRRLLAAHVVDDPGAPANYSLQLESPAPRVARTRPLHRLFEGGRELVIDADPAHPVAALLAALEGFAPPAAEHLQVWATVLVGPGGAVLAPVEWRRRLPALWRVLRRTAWRFLDDPFATLDEWGRVVEPVPALVTDPAVLGAGAGAAPPRLPVPVAAWLVPPGAEGSDATPAGALVEGMRLVRNRALFGGTRCFALLANVARRAAVLPAPRTVTDAQVKELLEGVEEG